MEGFHCTCIPYRSVMAYLNEIEPKVPSLAGVKTLAMGLDAQSGQLLGIVDVKLPSAVALVKKLLVFVDFQVHVVENASQVDQAVI